MSSGGMPELGSKISLISKADIRYEGRLFTVDPQECTIALANVRSFGTEDRETQYPIAPQSQIYDYILFRGTDIKDIRVVNNGMPHPNDPAIMQMQLPNGQHLMPHFPMPAINSPMTNYGAPFGGMGNIGGLGGPGTGAGTSTNNTAGNMAPGSFLLNTKPKQPNLITGGSRSTTPVSLISRKSPSTDMGVQVNQQQTSQQSQQHHQNAGNNRDAGHKRQHQQQNQRSGQNNYRDRRDSGRMDQHHDNQNNYGNQRNRFQNRGNWNNRGGNNVNMMRNRGRGRTQNQSYFSQGGYRQGGIGLNKNRPVKNTIKFDQDYDFEQANNKFEELRSQLAKLKVSEVESKNSTEQVNGETDTKKDDSGNETGAGEQEQDDDYVPVGYDKNKSFFDNISCEAADRSIKKNDWRQERKLNTETFGISSTRRGNYRGRGGTGGGSYYNRNMNNGGYNRNYRPNNYNNRGRNNRIGQNTGLPSKTQQATKQSQQQTEAPSVTTGAK
ncbi:protein LSM14 homolog A isoform X2 [Condylostylus longicornis]|uniref:protein LSM14 homolog A isoform X2 n=1 Tax=Condylostylus longicornis TaxID=2530218 RepID=UPI00244E3B9B|nr:protein LSM14 homolog A isoform X2 [Condylostylus longicornis]